MAQTPKLEQKLKTSLGLSPFMQQTIKVLQMSQTELQTYIEEELQKNPLLEREKNDTKISDNDDDANSEKPLARDAYEELNSDNYDARNLDLDQDFTYEQEDSSFKMAPNISKSLRNYDSNQTNYDNLLASETSFYDKISSKIDSKFQDQTKKLIALELFNRLDEKARLDNSYTDIPNMLGCDINEVEEVLFELQKFEPLGIFARNLNECLAIQLKENNKFDAIYAKILENLEMIAKAKAPELLSKLDINSEDFNNRMEVIKKLNPNPLSSFEINNIITIIPDLVVRKSVKSDDWILELNSDSIPAIVLNQAFYNQIKESKLKKTEKSFINNNWREASWLIRSIEQRNNSLIKVGAAIVKQQSDFLDKGILYLRPMVLKNIAVEVDMHESTISRISNGKFIQTPRGVFELKYFFTSQIGGSIGFSHSSEAVKQRILDIIKLEMTKRKVFSDEEICEKLLEDGIDIARRTIAKYRILLNIPTSAIRKRKLKQYLN